MRKITLLFAIAATLSFITLPGFGQGQELQAAECKTACEFFVSCTAEIHGRQPSAQERTQLMQGCMHTCQQRQQEVLACYAQSQNSCPVYQKCVMEKAR